MTRSPYLTFLTDQALAAARDRAVRDQKSYVVIADATGGRCEWCTCDVTQDDTDHPCTGCPRPAELVMHQLTPGGARTDVPLCLHCAPDALRFVLALFAAENHA
ncbi:hypothetical protein [Streptomyces sp. DW26H14]|uniref:hypothetical protein n=1 Tax=Streptomyces sp. DW26H14 TaxID=3435395 RepID=UPI00403E227D